MQCPARILVIGDDPPLRRLLCLVLSKLGTDVQETPADQVFEQMGDTLPHLLVVDHHLPQDEALPLSRELHRNPATAELPSIHLIPGGYASLQPLVGAGATVCLDKPFRGHLLRDAVKTLLETLGPTGVSSAD
jgi:CheY-like chemotaxis protein